MTASTDNIAGNCAGRSRITAGRVEPSQPDDASLATSEYPAASTEFHGLVVGIVDGDTMARLMQELADKRPQQFVTDLATELQVNHPKESGAK